MEGFTFGSQEGDQSEPSQATDDLTPNDSDSPVTEDEEEDFDPNNSSNLHQSELVMEHHLLKTRLRTVEMKLKESQDEIYFSQLKTKEKERKLIEVEGELNKQRSRHKDVTRQFDELQKTCQAQMSQNLELQYHLKKSNNLNIQQQLSMAATATDGTEKVKRQKDLATQLLRKKRKLREVNQQMMNQMAILEERMLWQEDPMNSTVGDLMESIRQRDEISRRQAARTQSLPTRQGSQLTIRSEASWDLPVHKTVLKSTEDTYVECKIGTSVFGDQLKLFREALYPLVRDYKDASDKSVTHLWNLYSNKKPSYRPKEDFFKETSSVLTKSKVFVANILRSCNFIIKEFLKEEKSIKLKWQKQHQPVCHVACEADIPPPEDPLVNELKQELQMLNTRIIKVRDETAAKEHNLTMAKDKAELSLRYLQKKLFVLHQELYSSLHQVYKHRFKWIARFPNPLREIHTRTKHSLDVKFNMQLGEIIDKDVEYLKRFGQYFTSDDTYGVDMSALCEERERARAEIREKKEDRRTSRTRSEKRRASAPAGLFDAKQESPKAGGTRADRKEWDFTRMESWRLKQRQLWEEKRRSSQRDAAVVPFKEMEGLPDHQRPASAAANPISRAVHDIDEACNWKKDIISGQTLHCSVVTGPPAAPDPTPPNIKATTDVFNRIILRRRNLPLRPALEPNLSEAIGYRLEGSKVIRRTRAMSQPHIQGVA